MITLRPYQQQCVQAFYDYYAAGNAGHGLIVLPTAGGKSLVIGSLISEICQRWPKQRILLLSHVRELISQNHNKIMACWPSAPAGIYSAALNKRQAFFPIVTATIQSVYRKAQVLGHRDLVFVDEVHLVNAESSGMYRELLKDLIAINPALKICGFTATPFRLDSGLLTEGKNALFDDIIIDISIRNLLEEGYLTPPISKASLVQADMKGVKITAGEYNIKQMAERFDQKAFISAALDNDMPFFANRKSIALFAVTLENAQHIAYGMRERGIECEVVDGTMLASERDDKLSRFRTGELRALASVGVITTGTDIPNMDAVVLFRATQSPGLYQQIIGRGFRVMYADGYDLNTKQGRLDAIRNGQKPNFITLDHGSNIERHGPITHVQRPENREREKRGRREKKNARICEICRSAWPLEAMLCGLCGSELVKERDALANLETEASSADIMGTPFSRGEEAKWFDVDDVHYQRHVKAGSRDSLRVTYYCGIMQFNEWVHFESVYPNMQMKADRWWGLRSPENPPATVVEALEKSDSLTRPLRIMVRKKDNKYYEVLQYRFMQETSHAPMQDDRKTAFL